MTVVAAVRGADKVWMGCDSDIWHDKDLRTSSKKIETIYHNGCVSLVGWSGLTAIRPIAVELWEKIRHYHRNPASIQQYAVDLTELALERGVSDEDILDANVLLAWKNNLWYITHYEASEVMEYTAIGSGAGTAIGALYATASKTPEERVTIAVESAIKHAPYVGGDTYVWSTE